MQTYSAPEYDYIAGRLTERCGYDHPRAALEAVVRLLGDGGPVDALMEEHRTFGFQAVNTPVRVMVAHYIAFCRDKLKRPEFFCWPGMWLAGDKATPEESALLVDHLSLFQDRADTEQIFPRAMLGRSDQNIKMLVQTFFTGMLVYDLALQWTLRPGPFRYDFKWLTGKSDNTALIALAKHQFRQYYGIDCDKCNLIDPP